MQLWVRLEGTPSVAFLVQRKNPTEEQLVDFHLALSMGYVDTAPFFCMSMESRADMANEAMGDLHHALPQPLNMSDDTQSPEERATEPHDDRQWTQSPTELRGHALAQVDVYLDDFISTCQGGPTEQ